MEENLSLERQQLRMLVEAIKKVVTHARTPEWIKKQLEGAVREAKGLQRVEGNTAPDRLETAKAEIPDHLAVGVYAKSKDPKDKCLYEIVGESFVIEGVQLWDVRIVQGDKNNPVGTVVHNVPETKISPAPAPR